MIGRADESPGAMLSGHIAIHDPLGTIVADNLRVRFSLFLIIKVASTSPITGGRKLSLHPRDVTSPREREPQLPPREVCHWDVDDISRLLAGRAEGTAEYTFEFSLHIPGHLSASTQNSLSSIEYMLTVTATPSSGKPLHTNQPVQIRRAVLPESTSTVGLRRYPDSQLVSKLTMPAVIHPSSEFSVQLELQGTNVQGQWTLMRQRIDELNWRVEEIEEVKSSSEAGAHHCLGNPYHKNSTRKIGEGIVRVGRDRPTCFDISGATNSIESVGFRVALSPKARVACDVELDPDLVSSVTPGTDRTERPYSMRMRISVSHRLVVEFNVVEELYDNKTGCLVDRIKGRRRMYGASYNLVITERPPSHMDLMVNSEREMLPRYCQRDEEPPAYEIEAT